MTKVTVLVAVYNASRYLSDCLNSLLEQTLSDIQVVCVDDASTDDSLSILQQYGSRDKRIEVVHLPENQGQGHARNIGLQMARGEYVCFLDADDWLERDALGQCVSVFAEHEDTDSVLFSVSMDYADHAEPYVLPVSGRLTGEEAFRMSLD